MKLSRIQQLLEELHVSLPSPPLLWCDNTSSIALASNLIFHAHTKHIAIYYHYVRELVPPWLIESFTFRLFLLLTVLPLTLAGFTIVLQWRGYLNDLITRWAPNYHEFPGMVDLGGPPVRASHSLGSDYVDLLG
ncbi:unnamed protein product [Prunus brigantina]